MQITQFNPATAHQAPARFDKSALWASTSSKPPQINVVNGKYVASIEGQQVGQPQDQLDVVILDEFPKGRNTSRTYFGRADNPSIPAPYDPKNQQIPTCHSTNGVTPDGNSKHPQSSACMTCPQSIAGSGGTQIGKACRFVKTIAVNVPAFGDEVFAMRISAQGIFDKGNSETNNYGLFGLNTALGNYAPQEVLVKLHMPEGQTGGTRFSPIGVLDDTAANVMVALSQSPRVGEVLRTDRDTTAGAPALPAPAALPQVALPAPVQYAAPQAPAPVYQAVQAPAPVYAAPEPVAQPVYVAAAAPVQQPVYAAPIPHVAPAPAVAVADVAQPVQAPVVAAAQVAAQPGFQSRLAAAFAPRK
jgi:hypothetical protein